MSGRRVWIAALSLAVFPTKKRVPSFFQWRPSARTLREAASPERRTLFSHGSWSTLSPVGPWREPFLSFNQAPPGNQAPSGDVFPASGRAGAGSRKDPGGTSTSRAVVSQNRESGRVRTLSHETFATNRVRGHGRNSHGQLHGDRCSHHNTATPYSLDSGSHVTIGSASSFRSGFVTVSASGRSQSTRRGRARVLRSPNPSRVVPGECTGLLSRGEPRRGK